MRWVKNKKYGDVGKNQLWQKPFNYCQKQVGPLRWVGRYITKLEGPRPVRCDP